MENHFFYAVDLIKMLIFVALVKEIEICEDGDLRSWMKNIEQQRFNADIDGDISKIIVVIDVAKKFIFPSQIVSLACLIEEYHINGIEVSFEVRKDSVTKYLKEIRFFEYWNTGFNRNEFTPNKISTSLCLWKITESMITPFNNKVQEYFERNYFKGKDLDSLSSSLSELFNNKCLSVSFPKIIPSKRYSSNHYSVK